MTTEEYEEVLRLIKDKLDGIVEITWDEIIDRYGINMHPNTLAKASNTIFGGQFVHEYFEQKRIKAESDGREWNKYLEDKIELEKERKKLQTEKVEWFRKLREEARDDLFEEKIINCIKDTLSNTEPRREYVPINNVDTNRQGLLCLSDQHFGKEFVIYGLDGEVINSYNPEIFKQRMNVLFRETVDYVEKEGFTSIKIFNLGDSLDGFLRHSQLWNLRYGVVDSAILYGQFMGEWLQDLSEYVNITYYQTSGNHGELRLLDGSKGQHINENIEKVTEYIIKLINKDNPNFKCVDNKSGYIYTDIAGYKILGIHGEVKNLEKSIKEFSSAFDTKINYLVAGHKHHGEYSNCGIKTGSIGVGSIVGSDDYSLLLRRTADATATFVIFEEGKGKVDEHTFVLN